MNKKKIVGISCIVLAVVIIFLVAVLRWCNIQIFNVLGTFFEGLFLALIISLPITIFCALPKKTKGKIRQAFVRIVIHKMNRIQNIVPDAVHH